MTAGEHVGLLQQLQATLREKHGPRVDSTKVAAVAEAEWQVPGVVSRKGPFLDLANNLQIIQGSSKLLHDGSANDPIDATGCSL